MPILSGFENSGQTWKDHERFPTEGWADKFIQSKRHLTSFHRDQTGSQLDRAKEGKKTNQ